MQEEFRYLPVSRRDRQWGLYATGAGLVLDATPDSDWSAHPQPYFYQWNKGRRVANEYMIEYQPHNRLEFESEVTPLRIVPAGSLVLLCPGVWHRECPVREPRWTQYWVWFGGSYADYLVREKFFSPKHPVFHVGMDLRLLTPFRHLLDRLRSSPLGLSQLLAASVMEILGVALALSRAGCNSKIDKIEETLVLVQQAKSILDQRIEENVDMQELAALLGVGYDQFRHTFKRLTGFAPYQYHLQLRIFRAKQLLVQTELSVKEIANVLKFDDSYHFSKMFKHHAGASPTKWRSDTHSRAGKSPSVGRQFQGTQYY